MAMNVLVPLLIPLGEQLTNVTQLVGGGPVEFTQAEYRVQVKENTRDSNLCHLRTRVSQQGASVEYRITGGNEFGAFQLNPTNGILALTSTLDYEQQQEYVVVVEARTEGGTSEARVVVEVADDNDHTPAFARDLHETQITEEDDRHLPKTIITVRARDGDAGPYGQLAYTITGDGVTNDNTSAFDVHPTTGGVLVLKPLDRDPPHGRARWRLRVTATDGELEAHTDVLVNLKDVNDNAPFFPQPTLHATISEDTPRGASVVRATATDHDDPREGHNAHLSYSLEKNVVDESTGSPILTIHTRSGLITTALCCLDREKTQWYEVQVVATDGGGLKGTGTVVVEVSDVNDVPPRFSRPEWSLSVSERQSPDRVLATLTVVDQDTTNNFTFRVVPGSGEGWQMFRVEERRVGAPGGDLRPLIPLDYENPTHRRGFRFRVEVTDVGEGGWGDKYHVDGTWVNLHVLDENDNPPTFTGNSNHAHLTMSEATQPPAHLATFKATDIDGGGRGVITYRIDPNSDPGGVFDVDAEGSVRLVGQLDRETVDTHTVLVWAADDGDPPRTATATLSVNVTDVNDNPPYISEPREVVVEENSGPQVVARVRLGDPDDWRQGHGPPFTLALDPYAPDDITNSVTVTYDRNGDGGRGVGVVETVRALDREAGPLLLVPLLVGDARARTATVTLTVHVADLNDNPMTPAARMVSVLTLKHPEDKAMVPLGRVYVQDPDDMDDSTKTYAWKRTHPSFTLDTLSGHLAMDPDTADGRYELRFLVSDPSQGQARVPANVTVEVKSLSADEVSQATLLTLDINPSKAITTHEGEDKPSVLERLVAASQAWLESGSRPILAWLDDASEAKLTRAEGSRWLITENNKIHKIAEAPSKVDVGVQTSLEDVMDVRWYHGREQNAKTRIWLAAPGVKNLDHILLYHKHQLVDAVGVGVHEVGVSRCYEEDQEPPRCIDGCWARVELGEGSVVVDARVTAVVGPRLEVRRGCGCRPPPPIQHQTCAPDTCRNDGRCIPKSSKATCICPYGTLGSRCKITSRYFEGGGGSEGDPGGGGGGFAWLPALPACSDVHLSLEVLTRAQDTLVIYSGPQQIHTHLPDDNIETKDVNKLLSETGSSGDGSEGSGNLNKDDETTTSSKVREKSLKPNSEMVLLELRSGRPYLLLDLGAGAVTLALNASYSLADNNWHRIDLIWKDELVELIVDLCSGASMDVTGESGGNTTVLPDAHSCRGAARLPGAAHVFNSAHPLQLGGLAHLLPSTDTTISPRSLTPFRGCIRNLRVNREVVDLGAGVLSRRSAPGCPAADCLATGLRCGLNARCRGGPGDVSCECGAGWTGQPECATPTLPLTLHNNTWLRLALSLTPLGYTTTITLRFRTRHLWGQLVCVSSKGDVDRLVVQLVEGELCVLLSLHPDPVTSLCLTRARLTDGEWHTVSALRQGSASFLSVDDGDGDLYNASVTLEGRRLLEVDSQRGITLGGPTLLPQQNNSHLHHFQGCLDDVRVGGVRVPLPPPTNLSGWSSSGGSDGWQSGGGEVETGCTTTTSTTSATTQACTNTTCTPPLTCTETWRHHQCSCGEGRVLDRRRGTCEDANMCTWRPCLNGGSCINTNTGPGYVCHCPGGFSGPNCILPEVGDTSLKISLGALVAILVWCVFLLLLVCAFLLHQHHKRSGVRRGGEGAGVKGATAGGVKEPPPSPCTHNHNLLPLQLIHLPPTANGQTHALANPNIADVDVLQVDTASVNSVSSSTDGRDRCCSTRQHKGSAGQEGDNTTPGCADDLRNYCYEGEGSSPGSLSSCLESCSGSSKFLGGFREVAHMLES